MLNSLKEVYITDAENKTRYVLGKYSHKALIVFGINPSTATKEKNDTTISILEKIAKMRNCDGYLIFNIYPVRAANIGKEFLSSIDLNISKLNLQYINNHLEEGSELIAAWGTHIKDSKYFIEILRQINNITKEKNAKWICLSKTKGGHPHHPTRLSYDKMTFEEFDIDNYIYKILK